MGTYVWVDPERIIRRQESVEVDGVHLTVEASPYDVPTAVRGSYDTKRGLFKIEFRYIDDEPAANADSTYDGISVTEGKHSGKLLTISIPIDKPGWADAGVIALTTTNVARAMQLRGKSLGDELGRVLNQHAAEDALKDSMEKLIPAMS